jgi:hypothetical protein
LNIVTLTYHFLVKFSAVAIPLIQEQELLEPIYEPDPITFSFNTPAWYVLGIVFVIVIIYFGLLKYKKHKHNYYRREALRTLESTNWSQVDDMDGIINKIRIVLKQVAIQKYERVNVAALYGEEWLFFLESKGNQTQFSNQTILISQQRFSDSNLKKEDVKELLEVSKKWIKTHA